MHRSVARIAVAFFGMHLAIALLVPIFDDEAYYTLWARYPSLGYYDHPPMVAYAIRLGTSIFGENTFGIRFIPILAMGISTILVGDSGRRLGLTESQASNAALLFNLGLLIMGVGSFATPDAPSAFFWLAGFWASLRAVQSASATSWAIAGLLIGFGMLSKFTNAFLPIGLLCWLVFTKVGRGHLKSIRPYIAVTAALLPLVPYLWWNFSNDWVGFERQGGRLTDGAISGRYLAEYILTFVLVPSPFVAWFAVRGAPAIDRRVASFVWWSTAPLVLYFFYHSTHAQVQANWLMPIQGMIAIFAGFALKPQSRWFKITALAAAIYTFGLLGAAFNPWVPIGTANNPPNQTRGWQQGRDDIAEMLQGADAKWIATTHYSLTGMLSYQFADLQVWDLHEPQRYGFRGDFPAALCEEQAILIEPETTDPDLAMLEFSQVGEPVFVTRSQAGVDLARYRLRAVTGPKAFVECR